jgi:hypothetical protein
MDIAYACALYPLASYQFTAAVLRAALTAAAGGQRSQTREPLARQKGAAR